MPRGGASPQRDVAGNDDHGDALLADRGAHRGLEDVGQLCRFGHEFAIHAAFAKQLLRVRRLKVVRSNLGRRDMCGDGEHRRARALAVEQAVDQVQVAGTAGTGAHGETTGHLGLGAGGEGGDLLVAHVHPVDDTTATDRLGDPVQAVTDQAVDALHPRLLQGLDDEAGDVVDLHG